MSNQRLNIKNISALCLLLCIFCLSAFAQEVTVITTNGDQITGSLQEFKNNVLKVKTKSGTLKIPAAELQQVDFVPYGPDTAGDADLHLLHGKQFLELGMEDEAMEEFRAAMHKAPMYARSHREIGVLLEKRGQQKEALQYYSRAIKLDPSQPGMAKYFIDVADAYYANEQLSDAADIYHLLYKTFPEDPASEDSVYQAGFLFAGELNDREKALLALEDAVAAFPESQHAEKALYEIGRLREEAGELEAAEGVLLQLILDYPTSHLRSDAHYILAKINHRKRRNADAIQELIRVMDEPSDMTLAIQAEEMLDEFAWNVFDISDGLPSDDIRSLARDGNYMWVGTLDGIALLDMESGTFNERVLLKGIEIQALAVDDYHLWVGTRNAGVRRYYKRDDTWRLAAPEELSNESVMAISVDKDNVWLGTAHSGIYRYEKLTGDWKNYTMGHGLPSNNIVSIASTPTGGVWCSTWKKGISFLDSTIDRWQIDPGIPSELSVTSIASGANYIWFAWYGKSSNGFSSYDISTKTWESFPLTEGEVGLINLRANNMEVGVGTDYSAILYDYVNLQWAFSNYPTKLSGNSAACVLLSNDSVWFGTKQGLGRLDRKMLRRIEYIKLKIIGKDNEVP